MVFTGASSVQNLLQLCTLTTTVFTYLAYLLTAADTVHMTW